MISKDTIDEILLRTDIASFISGYVSLKRSGDTLKGLCPFHSEKSPSFMVYPRTSSFYCFGCGVGGDVFSFVRQIENLDYIDADNAYANINDMLDGSDDGDDKNNKNKNETKS